MDRPTTNTSYPPPKHTPSHLTQTPPTNNRNKIFLLVAMVLHAAAFLAWGFLFIREQRGPKQKAKAH